MGRAVRAAFARPRRVRRAPSRLSDPQPKRLESVATSSRKRVLVCRTVHIPVGQPSRQLPSILRRRCEMPTAAGNRGSVQQFSWRSVRKSRCRAEQASGQPFGFLKYCKSFCLSAMKLSDWPFCWSIYAVDLGHARHRLSQVRIYTCCDSREHGCAE